MKASTLLIVVILILISGYSQAGADDKVAEWRVHYNAQGEQDNIFQDFWMPTSDGDYDFDTKITLTGTNNTGSVASHVTVKRKSDKVEICSRVLDDKGKQSPEVCTDESVRITPNSEFQGRFASAYVIYGKKK